jgi:hypothetical protein
LKQLRAPNGLLNWGGHMAWDLLGERPVGQYEDIHELKGHQPYFRLMGRVDPKATADLMEAIWAIHIVDWARLDYNRHARYTELAPPLWDHAFQENIEVPFPAKSNNLSFTNVTPPLLQSGIMLAVLKQDPNGLTWARRLLYRWQQGEHPKTGLGGGQLSYRQKDRAQEALGHVHPSINEAKIVASYHQLGRYHMLPLVQLQAGETLARTGDEIPLALLHLAAAISGKVNVIPPPIHDHRYFHCEFDGNRDSAQQENADKRTYDHLVFYGDY